MVSIYFSLTGSVSLLSAFIVSLLPTRWSHSWLLCTIFSIFSFLSFLLWFYDTCPQGRSQYLSPFMPGDGAALSRTKIANLNGGLTPNTAKYHTRGIYPIQDDRNKIKQFWRTYILAKVYKCALPLKLQRSVYSNGSSSSFFCSDLLVPYESGLDSIESTKTISLPLHQSFFFTPSYNETLRG